MKPVIVAGWKSHISGISHSFSGAMVPMSSGYIMRSIQGLAVVSLCRCMVVLTRIIDIGLHIGYNHHHLIEYRALADGHTYHD